MPIKVSICDEFPLPIKKYAYSTKSAPSSNRGQQAGDIFIALSANGFASDYRTRSLAHFLTQKET